jgi:acetyl esterase/lipase
MQAFGRALAVDRHPNHPLARLINCDFSGLPPLLFQAGGDEILLQDSIQGAAKAEQAGVETQLEVYEGMMHVFQIFGWLPEAGCAISQASSFIKNHLSQPEITAA